MKLADLLDEFNIVIDTAEGLTELRSLILGLAIRGKLVPQNPNDESASELLKKIETEKKRLYKEGVIRKPKKLKEVLKEKEPFEIPENWVWVKLGHLFNVYTGDSISKSIKEEKYTGVEGQTFLGTKDVNYGFQPINYETEVAIPFNELDDFNTAPKDSVLVCAEGGSAGKKCGYVEQDVCFGNKLICNVPFYKTNTRFLLGYILTDLFRNQFVENMTGIIGGISQTNYNKLLFPLPPLEEQNRIVNKFEELLEEARELETKLNRQTKLDEKLQLAVNAEVQKAPDADASKSAWNFITSNFDTLYHTPEAIDNLKKNILNEAVRGRLVPQDPNDEPASELLKKIEAEKQRLYEEGEIRKPKKLPPVQEDEVPFEIPESWEWARLSTVSNVEMGQSPPGNTYNKEGNGVPLINGPVEFGKGSLAKTNVVQYSTKPKKFCKEGDLLLCVRGSTLGRTNIAGFDACIGRGVAAIQPYFEGIYLHYYIVSERQNIYDFGTGSTFPSINKGNIENYIFPLPPLEEQHRIVRRIEELFAICDQFKAQLEQRQAVNERLVKGLVGEVLERSANSIQEVNI